jgi:type II secretory pathway component PulM
MARAHCMLNKEEYTRTGKYLILIAFLQQKWFRERSVILRYACIACLVVYYELFTSGHRIKRLRKNVLQ